MKYNEFLSLLRKHLENRIPETEVSEAIEYYRNLFEEAGPDKESSLLEGLGSPEAIAEKIVAEQNSTNDEEVHSEIPVSKCSFFNGIRKLKRENQKGQRL